MALKAGSRLGPYEVLAALGAGGMGEVYRARDTRLARDVAIKVLPAEFASNPERLRRFKQEARAAGMLNHPNILAVYDTGVDEDCPYLVTELLEGQTLRRRLDEGAITTRKALEYAQQISSGLAAAHEKGITHRDLKPDNLFVTRDGTIKILDFGLAKLGPEGASEGTTMAASTSPGAVLGTAGYMSPEQVRGLAADHRSDIFSFGVVLYEMLSGQRAFRAGTAAEIMAMIVREDPPMLQGHGAVDFLVRRCLEKEPSERFQSARDLGFALQAHSGSEAPADASRPLASAGRNYALLWTVALLTVVTISVVAIITFRRPPEGPATRTVKFTFTPSMLKRGGDTNIDAEVSVSHNGRHITYVEATGGQLWVRDIDQERARPVPGATNVYQVFWSPDDRFIGYANGGVKPGMDLVRIPVQGGTPVTICKLAGAFRRATWSANGETIVYCDTTGMYTVPAAGGTPTRILEHPHIEHPSFLDLPGGRTAVLFQMLEKPLVHEIQYLIVGEKERHTITTSSSTNPYPAYSSTGHIIYVDGVGESTAIWALPFSLATLKATGKAFPIAQLGSSPTLSRTGTLGYSDKPADELQLVWRDRSGKTLSTVGPTRLYSLPALSPDGRRLAVHVRDNGIDIWIYDLDRGASSRLTFDSTLSGHAAWSPSGAEITYSTFHNGNFDIMSKPSNGDGEAKVLVGPPAQEAASNWSPDHRFLVYETISSETKRDLLLRERRPDGSLGDAKVFLQTKFGEGAPKFSPDGRFIAYVSDESGGNEVYVRSFPNGEGKWRVSTNGGTAPRWRRDGKELFYGERRKLMAVSVTTQPAFSSAAPAALFESRALGDFYPQFDVTGDGKRFILCERVVAEQPLAVHVVHNWFEEFRGRQQK